LKPELCGQTDRFERLANAIYGELVAQMNRQRSLRAIDAASLRHTVNMVTANALGVWWHRTPKRVAYYRTPLAYTDKGTWPAWLSARLVASVVDGMARRGYLLATLGEPGRASQFEANYNLIWLAAAFGVTSYNLSIVMPRERLVRLKDGRKQLIAFEDTAETEGWRDQVDRYNSFISAQCVELAISDEQKHELLVQMGKEAAKARNGMGIIIPEFHATSVYRVFNDGTFAHGGRLYGPWWQGIPSEFRSHITINGQPTVELDYSGFAIRSIYHQAGIDYRGDPYELEEVCAYAEEQGLDRHHYRDSIKALAQALLNGQTGKPERISLPHSFRGKFTRKRLFEMLMAAHDPIRTAFASGEGIRNQRLDSDIALEIMSFMTQAEVPVLTIHDSFIVQEEHQFMLTCLMMDSYYDKLKFHPYIK
jgi:hypothetical protein